MIIKKEPFYKESGKEKEVFEHCYKNKLPMLLKGPTGTGKSRFVEHMAYQLKKPIYTIACHEETSATEPAGFGFNLMISSIASFNLIVI